MLNFNVQERYSASECLQHPWITRNFDDEIPLNLEQLLKVSAQSNKLINVIKKISFINHLNTIY